MRGDFRRVLGLIADFLNVPARLNALVEVGRDFGRHHLLRRAFLLASLGASTLVAEDNNDGPARFHEVNGWRGTLIARARANPDDVDHYDRQLSAGGRGAEWSFAFNAHCTVQFRLEAYESDPSIWTGHVTGSTYASDYHFLLHMPDSYSNNQTWWKGYSDHERNYSANGVLDFGDDSKVELRFHRERGWSVRLPSGRCATEVNQRWYKYVPPLPEQSNEHDQIIDESRTQLESSKSAAYGMGSTDTFPYPKAGMVLTGRSDSKSGGFPLNGSAGFGPSVIWDYTIYLEPLSMDELLLEIEEPPGYNTWRPMTTPDAAAGPELNVTARLVTASGKPPQTRVQQFIWELVGSSSEPGVAMNYPVDAKDDRFDLELDAAGERFVLTEKNQHLERAGQDGFVDSAKVVPYDWGGWSTMQVTAVLVDGRRIVGKLKGGKETGLRIPKRAADSHIADGWKAKNKSGPDNLDDDDTPTGDGTKGDGLSLYEEYRGFYEAKSHITTSPKKKDLFIERTKAPVALDGIALFRRTSRIVAHADLEADELPVSRVINANRRLGAQVCPQHGIRIEVDSALIDEARAYGGPGNPQKITKVGIMNNVDQFLGSEAGASYVAATVAHELGHCVNLFHHGEDDIGKVNWVVREGKLFENGAEITVLDEKSLADLTPDIVRLAGEMGISDLKKIWVGKQQGQHSGQENCLMRYDCGRAVVPVAPDNARLYKFTEVVGSQLCTSAAGTGVNDPNHPPQSRYGPARGGRGNCAHQILVTDAVRAPFRP